MVAVPTWLRGRDVGSIVLTGQSVAADGTLSDGTAYTVTGSLRAFRINSNPEASDASPVTSSVVNNIIEAENNTFEFDILLNGSGTVDALASLATSVDVIKAVVTRKRSGATTTPTTGMWTFYGTRGPFAEAVESRGANQATLSLLQADIGSANPTYT